MDKIKVYEWRTGKPLIDIRFEGGAEHDEQKLRRNLGGVK